MTTRLTDEGIQKWFDVLLAQHPTESDTCCIDASELRRIRDMWLTERQSARDGVTDEMVDCAAKVFWNNYYKDFDWLKIHPSQYAQLYNAMRAVLQSAAPAYNGKKEG